jgi:hypothetical protein
MKTAMQELIDNLDNTLVKSIFERLEKDGLFKKALEKEKEQIMNAYVKGFDISAEGWNGEYGIKDFNNIKEEIKAEELYNQTYNN